MTGTTGLVESLVLIEASAAHLSLASSALERFDPTQLSSRVARASRDAIIIPDGLEPLSKERLPSLITWCHRSLRPGGVLVLRLPRGSSVDPSSLSKALAPCFSAIEMFGWDGLQRTPPQDASTDSFAICRLFVPYAERSLDLLRPRVVASGSEWQSSWLCERPALPECFLLRATVDVIGESPLGRVDLRFKFIAPESARFRVEGLLSNVMSGTADLFFSSRQAEARGDPSWSEIERIAFEVRTGYDEPVDVRISDVRILSNVSFSHRAVDRTSAQLRAGYDADYYSGMPGYVQHGESRTLRERVNVHRSYALHLSPVIDRAVDVGSGRGELADRLIERGGEVTLLDYSPAAMEFARTLVGERSGARFVVDDAANLAAHVAEQSQDAIFMTDFVEHLTVDELRPVLHACRWALAADGALVINTPERYSGSIIDGKAIHGLHLNLFEIGTLEALLLEMFGAVDVFTWNGFECFREQGYCIDLFALARPGKPYPARALSTADSGKGQLGGTERASWIFELPKLPARFIFDATIEVTPLAVEGRLEIVFLDGAEGLVARVGRELSELQTFPVHLRLSSELLAPESPSGWKTVEKVVVRVVSHGLEPIALSVSNVRIRGG